MSKNNNLSGKTILLTRENNGDLPEILRARGAKVLEVALIEVEHTSVQEDVKDVMDEMGHYDWITFSSVNGVKGFFKEFFKRFNDIRCIGFAHIACVGESTAKELKKYFLRADVVPSVANAEAMLEKMAEYESLDNLKVLCVTGNLSSPEMLSTLENKHGAIADRIEVYKTSTVNLKDSDSADLKDFRANGADAVLFASPSAVESFLSNAKSLTLSAKATHPKIVSIGSTTSEALKKRSLRISAESPMPSSDFVADTIEKALK